MFLAHPCIFLTLLRLRCFLFLFQLRLEFVDFTSNLFGFLLNFGVRLLLRLEFEVDFGDYFAGLHLL